MYIKFFRKGSLIYEFLASEIEGTEASNIHLTQDNWKLESEGGFFNGFCDIKARQECSCLTKHGLYSRKAKRSRNTFQLVLLTRN